MLTITTGDVTCPGVDRLLTTGEVAVLLGVSRQHVVDLCNRGDLPYTLVGKHRRVRQSDVELLLSLTRRLTRDQLRSLLFGHAVAGRVVLEPELTVAKARHNLERMTSTVGRGSARVWLDEWSRLLQGPLPDLLTALTSRSQRFRDLRQNSPFAGVLTDQEREQVLATARSKTRDLATS